VRLGAAVAALAVAATASAAAPRTGRLDPGFGGDGLVLRRLTNGHDVGRGVLPLADGSVVVAAESGGHLEGFEGPDAVLLKLRRNGAPDARFGRGGVLRVSIGQGDDGVSGVARLQDGSLLVGGAAGNLNADQYGNDVAVFAFKARANGRLDPRFGRRGVVSLRVPTQNFIQPVAGIAADPDGAVVVAAMTEGKRLTLVRFDSRGRVDRSFGKRGVAHHDVQYPYALTRQPDGRLVVVGMTERPDREWREWFVLRLRANGTRDPSFGGGDGLVVTPWSNSPDAAYAVAVDAYGRIVVAGYAGTSDGNCTTLCQPLRLVRYLPDGRIDRSFARAGRAEPRIGLAHDRLALALESGGGIVVAGSAHSPGANDPLLAVWRFDSSGRVDRSFGTGGMLAVNAASGSPNRDYLSAVAVARDGAVVATGGAAKPQTGFDKPITYDVAVLRAR
jgi:uncharacterized delta-60 repeat protein